MATDNADDVISEYQFLRSFGMHFERACRIIGRSPRTVARYYSSAGLDVPSELHSYTRSRRAAS